MHRINKCLLTLTYTFAMCHCLVFQGCTSLVLLLQNVFYLLLLLIYLLISKILLIFSQSQYGDIQNTSSISKVEAEDILRLKIYIYILILLQEKDCKNIP